MKRILVPVIVILVLVLAVALEKNRKTPETTEGIDTKTLSATTATPTPSPSDEAAEIDLVNESDPLLEEKKPEPTRGVTSVSCSSVKKELEELANEFMQSHQKRDAATVLGLISTPYAQVDQDQLDFWLGLDNENIPRLYETPETNYTVSAYTLGRTEDRGQDADERGSKRCQMLITETRAVTTTIPYSETTVSRYLDFSVDISGFSTLSAYRNGKDGKKYSGF